MLLRLLRRFLEGLHFCDSGSPPLPKVSESSVSDTVEPLSDGEDCAKASMEISETLLANINRSQTHSFSITKKPRYKYSNEPSGTALSLRRKSSASSFAFIQSLAAKIVRAMKQRKITSEQTKRSFD